MPSIDEFNEYLLRRVREERGAIRLRESGFAATAEAYNRAVSQSIVDAYRSNTYNVDTYSGSFITPEASTPSNTPSNHQWPIGTILKWNLELNGVREYLINSQGIENLSNALVKVIEYEQTQIKNPLWFGEIERHASESYGVYYFILATPQEIELYNNTLRDLRQCTERPSVGTVVKYIGRSSEFKGKRAVVHGHTREKIDVTFIPSRRTGVFEFNLWQISKRQDGSFFPDMTAYCNCNKCHSLRPINSSKKIMYKNFCDAQCANEYGFNYCRNCGEWQEDINLLEVGSEKTCNTCFIRYYTECMGCNNHYNITTMRTLQGRPTCQNCISYATESIHSYSYKPAPIYNKMCWENTRYLGIELEIEMNDDEDIKPMAKKIKEWLSQQTQVLDNGKKLERLVYLKSDGSLEDGIEIVFHPFTLKSLHKNFPIKTFLEFLSENGANISDRCGMHVHVSKDKLNKIQLLKGKWVFYKCEQFLKKFSHRNHFKYCEFEGIPQSDVYNQPHGRRTALNIAGSSKTLELRMFASTLNYNKFMANLQFSDAFVDYIQHGAGIVFLRTHTPHQVWENFIDYCKKDGKWQLMTNYILRNAIV